MEGNVVTAAKWLGSSMVLASLIFVGGMRWALSSVDWAHPAESSRIPAEQAMVPTTPGDLKKLAEVFHGGEGNAVADQASATQFLKQSESLRQPGKDWERFWFQDHPPQPVALPPREAEGGVKP